MQNIMAVKVSPRNSSFQKEKSKMKQLFTNKNDQRMENILVEENALKVN